MFGYYAWSVSWQCDVFGSKRATAEGGEDEICPDQTGGEESGEDRKGSIKGSRVQTYNYNRGYHDLPNASRPHANIMPRAQSVRL